MAIRLCHPLLLANTFDDTVHAVGLELEFAYTHSLKTDGTVFC